VREKVGSAAGPTISFVLYRNSTVPDVFKLAVYLGAVDPMRATSAMIFKEIR